VTTAIPPPTPAYRGVIGEIEHAPRWQPAGQFALFGKVIDTVVPTPSVLATCIVPP
jgi:hypothetical protein